MKASLAIARKESYSLRGVSSGVFQQPARSGAQHVQLVWFHCKITLQEQFRREKELLMRLDATAHGVYPIAPTPFHPDGRIDEASIDRLCEAYTACGANGATVLG